MSKSRYFDYIIRIKLIKLICKWCSLALDINSGTWKRNLPQYWRNFLLLHFSHDYEYRYTRLPTHCQYFRLLEIRKASLITSYHFRAFPLEQTPAYTAISYTWGSNLCDKRIIINGIETLPVTASAIECLEEVVRVSEVSKRPRKYVWIDSICINQDDPPEKASQIQLMDRIYSQATEVVAVLGKVTGNHEIERSLFDLVAGVEEVLSNEDTYRMVMRNFPKTEWAMPLLGPEATLMVRVLCHPYWTRLWIIQELVFAKRVLVYCAGHTKTLSKICEEAAAFPEAYSFAESAVLEVLTIHKPWIAYGHKLIAKAVSDGAQYLRRIRDTRRGAPLTTLMSQFRYSKASLSRDRIFALLNIAGSEVSPGYLLKAAKRLNIDPQEIWWDNIRLIPDYIQPLREINTRLSCVAAILDTQQMLLLAGVGWPFNDNSTPSWMINWDSIFDNQEGINGFLSKIPTYQASNAIMNKDRAMPHFVPLTTRPILGEFGYQDTITFMSSEIDAGSNGWVQDTWREVCKSVPDPYPRGLWPCSRVEACWKTLFRQRGASKPRDRCHGNSCDSKLEEYLAFAENVPLPSLQLSETNHICGLALTEAFLLWISMSDGRWHGEKDDRLKMWFATLLSHSPAVGKRFVVTDKGFVGLVPPRSMVGDKVYIHSQHRAPVLLREAKDRGSGLRADYKHYRLVGTCYIFGLMDGEPGADHAYAPGIIHMERIVLS